MSSEYEKSLVLVVGAGASAEVDLPVGSQLKNKIASALDIQFRDGTQKISGDDYITEALRIAVAGPNRERGNINPFLQAGWMIRDAMPQAASIDNFIDAHRNDPRIEKCGKLAIARCILEAESKSKLHIPPGNINKKINFKATESTWFNGFFQRIVEGCQSADLPDRLSRVAIITFNYDRCIEHYFHASLRNYYDLDAEEATEAMSNLAIYHPYGSLGPLLWKNSPEGIEFGAIPHPQKLLGIATQLKTFTEGTDANHSDIIAIRRTMHLAERVAFLGFAFNPQNLQLLYGELGQRAVLRQCPVFGTALGISGSDVNLIKRDLEIMGGHPIDQIYLGRDNTCSDLIQEYGRSLSMLDN